MIETLNINSAFKPELRTELTTNNTNCLTQIFDPSTGGHQFDNYWNRTVSMTDFFAESIENNDCAALSTIKNKAISKTDIYPNPTNDQLFISHNSTEVDIYLYNAQGKLLKEINSVNNGNSISIGNLTNGVYYLKVKSDKKTTTHKVIKSEKQS